jgi:hypothetical protein
VVWSRARRGSALTILLGGGRQGGCEETLYSGALKKDTQDASVVIDDAPCAPLCAVTLAPVIPTVRRETSQVPMRSPMQ